MPLEELLCRLSRVCLWCDMWAHTAGREDQMGEIKLLQSEISNALRELAAENRTNTNVKEEH